MKRGISQASPAQRQKCTGAPCIVTGWGPCDPAHLIDRSITTVGQDDPRAVVPLRRDIHRMYDTGTFDLLPYLEPNHREELAYAVLRVGLLATLRRVTNARWAEAA